MKKVSFLIIFTVLAFCQNNYGSVSFQSFASSRLGRNISLLSMPGLFTLGCGIMAIYKINQLSKNISQTNINSKDIGLISSAQHYSKDFMLALLITSVTFATLYTIDIVTDYM